MNCLTLTASKDILSSRLCSPRFVATSAALSNEVQQAGRKPRILFRWIFTLSVIADAGASAATLGATCGSGLIALLGAFILSLFGVSIYTTAGGSAAPRR